MTNIMSQLAKFTGLSLAQPSLACHEKSMIGEMMIVNHWPNQVLLAGVSKGPVLFSFGFGMA